MNILSFQSEVVFGHVGQGAARFALQRLGHEVWALPTVLLSNHAGYACVEGETIAADRLRRLLDGLSANGWLAQCDAVLSGYLGSAEQADAIAEAVARVRQGNGRAIYCLDPVLGDEGRAYVGPGVAEAIARTLLPLADMVTPNAFELVHLSGLPVRDRAEALAAAARLGRALVVATSIPAGADGVGTLAVSRREGWFASHPRLDDTPPGAGDLFAALFLAARLSDLDIAEALRRSAASVFHILAASRGSSEMRLIAEQDSLAVPPEPIDFHIERIA
ncbi:MAG TPA: pyridoxal kinase [Rhizomicrobium sp.]